MAHTSTNQRRKRKWLRVSANVAPLLPSNFRCWVPSSQTKRTVAVRRHRRRRQRCPCRSCHLSKSRGLGASAVRSNSCIRSQSLRLTTIRWLRVHCLKLLKIIWCLTLTLVGQHPLLQPAAPTPHLKADQPPHHQPWLSHPQKWSTK